MAIVTLAAKVLLVVLALSLLMLGLAVVLVLASLWLEAREQGFGPEDELVFTVGARRKGG